MQRYRIGMAVLALGALMLPAAWAQDAAQNAASAGGPPPAIRGGRMDPERQVRRLTRELDLNSAQQQQVRQIVMDRDAKMRQLHQNSGTVPQQEMREQMRQTMMDSDAKIRGVLNPDQTQKFDAMRAQQREKMIERRGGEGTPAPGQGQAPTPPPQQQ